MHLKEVLKKFLKSIGADTRSAIVGYIVAMLIVVGGGLSALYKTSKEWGLQILTTPTPLWATISLVLLGGLYIYRKSRIAISAPFPSPSPSAKLTKTKHIPYESLVWIATKYSDGTIQTQDVPRCEKHDLLLTYDGHTYHCPEVLYDKCVIKLTADSLARFRRLATSYIDKHFRDEPPLPPQSPRPKSNWVTDWRR